MWSMYMAGETDQQLVARVQKGDKRAFDLLVVKYQHRIAALVSRFVKDADEVQDITQEAFIKAYRAIEKFRGDSQFYTWLYRIAVNTAKNYLVARNRRPPNDDVEADEAIYFDSAEGLRDVDSPEENIISEQLMKVINAAIKQLPEDLRTALTLREYDGLSYEQIAEVMACPVGTVRSRIFRAREAVDNAMRAVFND